MPARPRLFPWLSQRRKTDPELPLEPPVFLGDKSNGEFYHQQTPQERRIRELILRDAESHSRRLGIDRREFLASAAGMAASLWAINLASGCGGSSGGGYQVPPPGSIDCAAAGELLGGSEFILDLQTHHIEDEATWQERHPGGRYTGAGFAQFLTLYQCDLDPRWQCIGPAQYLDQIFINSDTSVAVLSGFPSAMCDDGTMCTNLNSNEGMVHWRDFVNEAAGGSQRVVQHCQISPNDRWDLQREMMQRIRRDFGNHGWKCYPPWGPDGKGWWLDDEAIATPFIETCRELGEPLVCAHKGFPLPGFDQEHSDPRDVGPAAVRFPDVHFVIYHSAYITNYREGPYDPDGPGVDRLIKTVEQHQLRGKNVYAELGSAWALAMNNAVEAQHLIGKLLKHLGDDNVVWGSECLWFGSPQRQIEAFRALEISEELQERHGYPALTPERKAKIFGRNGAKLYGIDPDATRCAIATNPLSVAKARLDSELGDRRWAFQQPFGPQSRREFLAMQSWRQFIGRPA